MYLTSLASFLGLNLPYGMRFGLQKVPLKGNVSMKNLLILALETTPVYL